VLTTDVVTMELLAGVRDDVELSRLRARLRSFPRLHIDGPADFEQAASIYRSCRARGETVRRLNDCLVAAVAIRNEVPILHSDRDFDVIARHTALAVYPLDA
jgi:predicted nucleic acid-binding protein